jgi:hydrogenase maturation protease
MKIKSLVLGLGNDILTDDGIGPRLVTDLQKELSDEHFDFLNVSVGGLELLDHMQGYETVFILDAIKTEKGKPGDVFFLTTDDFKETSHISNLHDINFLTALKLAEKLNLKVPTKIFIIAIEIIEDRVFSDQLSPEIAAVYEEIKQNARDFISIAEGNDD